MFVHKKKGYDTIPGLEKAIKVALAAKFIRESVLEFSDIFIRNCNIFK